MRYWDSALNYRVDAIKVGQFSWTGSALSVASSRLRCSCYMYVILMNTVVCNHLILHHGLHNELQQPLYWLYRLY
jgi:hypothetical protein